MDAQPRKFAWSWSRLKNWRTCPKRHWHCDIAKDFQEEESGALLWGHRFHDAMAKHIEKGEALPKTLLAHKKWPEKLRAMKENGVTVEVELKLAMDEKLQPTDWFDRNTWFRGVVDVLALDDAYAVAVDWKTGGKIQPDMEQLALNAQLIMTHYDIRLVHTSYWWTQHLTETTKTYQPADMVPLWSGLMPEIRAMEKAHNDLNYPPKPSGLCVRHCPVKSCPHHGVGSPRR